MRHTSSVSFIKLTRFVKRLIWLTWYIFPVLSFRRLISSPGTMFQYLIRSWAFVNLVTGSSRLLRICQYSGRGNRCRKSLVSGDFVHAWATCCLVQPQCFVECMAEEETRTRRRA